MDGIFNPIILEAFLTTDPNLINSILAGATKPDSNGK